MSVAHEESSSEGFIIVAGHGDVHDYPSAPAVGIKDCEPILYAGSGVFGDVP
ncbi:19675_t:CDS:2 [Entrophospora sp. SA101]|nr:14626_t:CDS:2 [Entrophospora sp. SA101]CAJ0917169.1 19671_t:CDS:2 [Entrophospora sp. SA101]CAJ0917179.1 19675_t:CDS:2 [Entrophospora sp. SA101]